MEGVVVQTRWVIRNIEATRDSKVSQLLSFGLKEPDALLAVRRSLCGLGVEDYGRVARLRAEGGSCSKEGGRRRGGKEKKRQRGGEEKKSA